MKLLKNFEHKMASIMEGSGASRAAQSKTVLPFKKLARALIKEMKHETMVIDKQDVAPSLYTILVSPQDNALMSRYYAELSKELQLFLEEQARELNLSFEERPLVRFVVDQKLKNGQFFPIVENVPAVLMAQLRREEQAFLSGKPLPLYGFASGKMRMGASSSMNMELSRPLPKLEDQLQQLHTRQQEAYPQNMPAQSQAYLINLAIGKRYALIAPQTLVGRDETQVDIAIFDSNISRKHAAFMYEQGCWIVEDLGSTNGTKVNGQRIVQRELLSGDKLCLGTTELVFEEA